MTPKNDDRRRSTGDWTSDGAEPLRLLLAHGRIALLIFLAAIAFGTAPLLAADDPVTNDDTSIGNDIGLPVTIAVLNNDTPDSWLAATVRIVDPADLENLLT